MNSFHISFNQSSIFAEIIAPADKAIWQRALIIAAISTGTSLISNKNNATDINETINSLKSLGVEIIDTPNGFKINGVTVSGLKLDKEIYLGNSGTSARLIIGLLASFSQKIYIKAGNNLKLRSMQKLIELLRLAGAQVEAQDNYLPFMLAGSISNIPFEYNNVSGSAQLKSAALLLALNAHGKSKIIEGKKSRDHTEKLLQYFGADLEINENDHGYNLTVTGHPKLYAQQLDIPGDPSSAAFIVVLALISNSAEIIIKNILYDKTRLKYIEVLQQMGGSIELYNIRISAPFELVDIKVKTSNLKAINLAAELYPALVDEYIIIAIAALFAHGQETVFQAVTDLINKESNRIDALIYNLSKMGVEIKYLDGNLYIHKLDKCEIKEIIVESFDDHRIMMAMVILGLALNKKLIINDPHVVNKSYPNFWNDLKNLGVKLEF